MNVARSLEPLFHPRSVAVIGASRDECSIGGIVVRNLESFRGPFYLINPHTNRIGAFTSYPSILAVPGEVDLAFVAVPAYHVLSAIRECVAKPVRAIVVISAGFAEIGSQSKANEQEILALVRAAGIPMVGPNCLGILTTDPTTPLNGTFIPFDLPSGNIAIITQSGAVGFILPELLRSQNLGVSSLVSLGNKLDLGENDFLQHWLTESSARTVVLYLESFQNPRELLNIAHRLPQNRQIVVLKAGRTTAGSRAAGSHTAALATPDRLADGLIRQAGMLRVANLEELFNTASLTSKQPLPQGKRIAVITNAGGLGVLCTDAIVDAGCEVPELSIALQERIRSVAPPHATVRNPIDLVASVDPQLLGKCLEFLLKSDEIDAIVVIYVPRLPGTSFDIARAVNLANSTAQSPKTLITVFLEDEQNIGRLQQELKGIPCFRNPESAGRTLALSATHAARRTTIQLPAVSSARLATAEAREIVEQFLRERGDAGGWLPAAETQRVLSSIGLPVPAWQIANSQEMAVQSAEQIGFPVVLKAVAPHLIHKAAAGGVVLDVRDATEVRNGWRTLEARIVELTSVLVQKYLPASDEAIMGAKWESNFGHVIGLGAGGRWAERLREIEFRLLPLTPSDAFDLIRDSALAETCLAAPNQLSETGQLIYEALLGVSALVSAIPEISEMDLNPVALLPALRQLSVLDARIHVVRRPTVGA